MREFADVAVRAFAPDDDRRFAFLDHAEWVGCARQIVVHRGAIEVHAVGHAEPKTFGHRPTAFGVHDRAGVYFVLSDYMVNRPAEFLVSARIHAMRPAKTELHEIRVVNVQIEQAAAGFGALKKILLAPGGWFSHAAEAGGEDFAELLLSDGGLEPRPFRPETHAHGRHEKALRTFRGRSDLAGGCGRARERLFADDVLASPEGG